MPQTLVLGPLSEELSPSTTLIAGPWIFAGQEEKYPHWENSFSFAPEPFEDRQLQAQAIEEAGSLTAQVIPRIAQALAPKNTLPSSYWETVLLPPTMNLAKVLVSLWYRVHVLTKEYKDIQVALLPEDCHFHFGTDADLVLHGALNPRFAHWILSLLLRPCLPASWQVSELPAITEDYPETRRAGAKEKIRALLLKLPFPRMKGMSLWQSLRYSLALSHRSTTEDKSRPLGQFFCQKPPLLPFDPLPLFMACLPASVQRLRHPQQLQESQKNRIRAASILLYEDAQYRQELALFRGQGGRLLCVQHGGNYGQMLHISTMELVEYSQHSFITWGWTAYTSVHRNAGNGPFIPLPPPQLARMKDAWTGSGEKAIFVGTEMPSLSYQLDAHPTPLQVVQYRKDKVSFFKSLAKEVLSSFLYRPYFPVPGTLLDADYVMSYIPDLQKCVGPLAPQMLQCKLLVLDHHGTTLLEAMAANIPLVCYWNPEHWPVTEECHEILTQMQEVGIWHSSPLSAAKQIMQIWSNPSAWWNSPSVQAIRRKFQKKFALVSEENEDTAWLHYLKGC